MYIKYIGHWVCLLRWGWTFITYRVWCKGPVTQAQTQGLHMDREQIPTFTPVLRDCRFWTVQNSASHRDWRPIARINVFLMKLTPFLCDPYVIRAQIARHAQHLQIAQKSLICSRSIRNPSVLPVWPGLKYQPVCVCLDNVDKSKTWRAVSYTHVRISDHFISNLYTECIPFSTQLATIFIRLHM